jgi:hypothetical protein
MTLSREDRDTMDRRGELSPEEAALVDDVFALIYSDGRAAGLTPDTCDGAATLEAALIRYLFDSRREEAPTGNLAKDLGQYLKTHPEAMREVNAGAREQMQECGEAFHFPAMPPPLRKW